MIFFCFSVRKNYFINYNGDHVHLRRSNMTTSANLLEKIKHKLLSMDLFTQMDKAKELTNFALTHQAISREEKL